jgi:hypothetical protein
VEGKGKGGGRETGKAGSGLTIECCRKILHIVSVKTIMLVQMLDSSMKMRTA